MLTKEQKQNMKERLEKAKEPINYMDICEGISCEECPFDYRPVGCRVHDIINNINELIYKLRVRTCSKCGAVLDDEKENVK